MECELRGEKKGHTLESDILVQPDAPTGLVFLVDGKLLPQQVVTLVVDLFVVLIFNTGINRTKLAIPDLTTILASRLIQPHGATHWNTMLLHELDLPFI